MGGPEGQEERRTARCGRGRIGYEVLLTVDQGVPRQRRSIGRKLSIIVVRSRTNQMEDLLGLAPAILQALESIQLGQTIVVPFPS